MQKASQFTIMKMPACSGTSGHKIVIGLVDASGSMSQFWTEMVKFWNTSIAQKTNCLITFSSAAKLQQHPYLNQNINMHGNSNTNILAAFTLLDQRLDIIRKSDPKAETIIIFISDGDDTVNGKKKVEQAMNKKKSALDLNITFICLGIKKNFPTSLSMQLRALYHTGDQGIPSVYLIQYASEKAFFNKFQSIEGSFKTSSIVQIDSQFCKVFPWEKVGQRTYKQNQWIMVDKKINLLKLKSGKQLMTYQIPWLKSFQIDDLVDCFRGWLQKVQLLSMQTKNMKEVKKIAEITADEIRKITIEFELINNLNIISEKVDQAKQSFKERAANHAAKTVGVRIVWFLNELDIIAKGTGIGSLSQFDKAKRLAIGTITGKYHQKALALKGITVSDFQKIKQEFEIIFNQVKLSPQPSTQQPSIFTLQNQKDLFMQPDFLEGLRHCKSQFDLIQTFPVVGYSLKIKRYDGSMINPWKVRLLSLAKHHKSIDSMYLAKNNNKYQLNVGEDQKQEINAVLPLFEQKDLQMAPLLNTKLYRLAISFMAVQNIDTYHQEAYLALLGSVFVYLIKQSASQWKNQLLTRIYSSFKVTYGATQQYKSLLQQAQTDFSCIFNRKGKQDHVDIVKVMLLAFVLYRQKCFQKQKVESLVDMVLVHFAQKCYVQCQFKLQKVVQIKLSRLQKLKKQSTGTKSRNEVFGLNELAKLVDLQFANLISKTSFNIELNDRIFTHSDQERRVTYQHISQFYQMIVERPLKKQQIFFYFERCLQDKNKEYYNAPINRNRQSLQKYFLSRIDIKKLSQKEGKIVKKVKNSIENKLIENFRQTHFGIKPQTQESFKALCQKLGRNPLLYHLNPLSGLVKNTCMSEQCIFYMQPLKDKQLSAHLKLWRGQLPARFHWRVNQFRKEGMKEEQMLKRLKEEGIVRESKHKKDDKFVWDYLSSIMRTQ